MEPRFRYLLLTAANILIPIAILTFATGFFPYKPFMPGLARFDESKDDSLPAAPFNKLVFMVVDALRSDFVFSEDSGFKFTQSLISSGAAIPFTAHATSPTITMPRVKAMTTGSIPSFLDVILNFAESDTSSTLANQDTWLAQLKAKEGGNLVMYGDDTWLKLFPDTFTRADGTSSFFVSDFTEVDNNVTRHVPNELLESDWNAMIMHYLGLDHIGHKAGPRSPNMLPKQREMDGIVQEIYEAIEGEPHLENTLFVLCGDHGMNDGGNHGGSAPGETSPALVFMSPKLKSISQGTECPTTPREDFDYYTKVEQSDIVPTLAGLLGFPVPLNNLGVFIPPFLSFWRSDNDRLQLLLQNARQMLNIVKATFPNFSFEDEVDEDLSCRGSLSSGQELACKWQALVKLGNAHTDKHATETHIDAILDFSRSAQDIMSSTASNYDLSRLVFGSSIAFISVALTLSVLRRVIFSVPSSAIFYFIILILYGVLMFASSYVEEEQHFWYWAASAWLFYLFIFDSREEWFRKFLLHPCIMALGLLRIVRRWNQTGQKHAGAPDIVHSSFLRGGNSLILWSLIGATYMDITIRLGRHIAGSLKDRSRKTYRSDDSENVNRVIGTLSALPVGIVAFVFKLSFTARDAPELTQGLEGGVLEWVETLSLVAVARIVFSSIGMCASWFAISEWRATRANGEKDDEDEDDAGLPAAFFDLLALFLVTQTRAQNIPLYLIFRMQTFFLSLLDLTPTQITITSLLMSHVSFFALGNSNAISSIDLSNSYNGVSGYNVGAVGLLVFLSNWAGPIYWSSVGAVFLGTHVDESDSEVEPKPAIESAEKRSWVEAERAHLKKQAEVPKAPEDKGPSVFFDHVSLLTLFTSFSLLAVMVACTALRTHLFIWTVFSPKYLYAMAWGIAFHLGISVGWGSLLWWTSR